MTTTTQMHSFAIDGFPLTGLDDYGCLWTVRPEIEGWFTGGEVRTSTEARSGQSGDWRSRSYRSGRIITLRGLVKCPDAVTMEQAGRRLSALLGDGGFGLFVGTSDAGTLQATVQLEDFPRFDAVSDSVATWQVTVGSEDPLLYGPEVFGQTSLAATGGGTGLVFPLAFPLDFGVPPGVTPGAISVANAGTASYFPRLRIDGPVTNPVVSLVETGDTVRFDGVIGAGQHLDINWGTPRRVTIGDNPVSMRHKVDSAAAGNWLSIPIGGGSISYSADDANPAALLSVWSYEGAYA